MIHNASIEKYRTPVGAVTCGSEMMIRLYDVGQEVNKAEIIMYSESFHREYEMKRKKDCMEEHIKMTSEAGVVWYYFRIWEHGKCYFYGARHGKTQGERSICMMTGKNSQYLDHFQEKNFMIHVIILVEILRESYPNLMI